ncbi:thyrotropin-releasing hormone receptor-like [Physella acuta]|uniref:thyrotropin-releasing hormone receptor-like n=1 Tax=Physella acuta TaxID=109671 RepID=UPI0027DBCAAB|nr:thyrotropin-releasing hormone receptor-like [Physella acuta]
MNRTIEVQYTPGDAPWAVAYLNTNTTSKNTSDDEFQCNSTDITQAMRAATDAFGTYAVPVICVLGILGDVTSLLVFICTSFRYQPCSQYLAALACVDTLFLMSPLLSSLMRYFPSIALTPGCCVLIVYTSYVCSFLSAWFVVLMMIERFIVVCYPFKASYMCNKKKSIAVISATSVLALILYCHSFFTVETSIVNSPCHENKNYIEFLSIFTHVDSILVFFVPFSTIVFLNLKIIQTVRKFRLRHDMLNQSVRRTPRYHNSGNTLTLAQVRSTKMLVWVSSVYIILYLPSYAVRMYGLILQQVSGVLKCAPRLYVAQQLCQHLHFLNFAIDFLVYVVTSNNFRRNVSRCLRKFYMTRSGCKYRYDY